MKKKFILLIISTTLLGVTNGIAQPSTDNVGKTSLFLELGGSGWLYSLNVDHQIHSLVSLRAGISTVRTADLWFIGGPILINALPGWGNHRIEIGAGALLGQFSNETAEPHFNDAIDPGESKGIAFVTLNAGYRYQPKDKNLFLRISYTPFITSNGLVSWAGIGVGFILPK